MFKSHVGLPAILILAAGACIGGTRTAEANGVGASLSSVPASAPDTSLFGTVLRALPRDSIYQLRVDPRPLKPDPGVVYPHASDLADISDSVRAARQAVVGGLGATTVDAVEGGDCQAGLGGLRRAPSGAPRRAPDRRPFCVITALPRPGGAYFPPGATDKRSAAPEGAVSTRAVVLTASFTVAYDVVALRDAAGGWRVLDVAEVYRTWS